MATSSSTFTTAWTPPESIVGLSASVVEELSHIQLNWDISELADIDFLYYEVQRREVGTTSWTVIKRETGKTNTEWKDVAAGQGITYEYRVQQFKNIPGDTPLESDEGDVATAALESDVWFVIGNEDPYDEDHAFELPIAGEAHTRPIQQEVFEPIASNRKKVARGNVLGYEGSLSIRWTTTERTTAKTQLDFLTTFPGPHLLKSPFGDVWRVEFDSPDYKYAGGGHLDVEIGWVEVV